MDLIRYYGNVKHSQDKVLSIVLLSGQVEKIIPMLKEGYTVTGKLLETLRVLGREDLIDTIVGNDFQYSDSATMFILCYYGKEKYQLFIEDMAARDRQKKLEKEKRAQEEKEQTFEKLSEDGLSKELLLFANKNGMMNTLVERFGEEEVYGKICETGLTGLLEFFSDDFLFARGDFRTIRRALSYGRCNEEVFKKAFTYFGGPEAVYKLKNNLDRDLWDKTTLSMCRLLVETGHKNLFYDDNQHGFRDLDAIDAMTLDDWKRWKNEDEKAMRQYLREHKPLSFRAKLVWKLR